MKTATMLLALLLTACAAPMRRPDFSKISVGMSQQEVVTALGKPMSIAANDGTTYLQYGYDNPFDSEAGVSEWFFVRLVGGKVDAFGSKGDFDSTKDPAVNIAIKQQ
jgi:hypothetical protein